MNIHEYQAKEILRNYKVPVPNGITILKLTEIEEKIKKLNKKNLVIKAQIHAGGRGKAGGIKLIKNKEDLIKEAKKMLGKTLITHQTGPEGKKVKKIYIEEATDIDKEFYLSCVVDRKSSKIAFITSSQGGTAIEKIASKSPEKITTIKIDSNKQISKKDIENIIRPFSLNETQKKDANNLINTLFKIFKEKDASLIEINPLIVSKSGKLICLDA